MSQWLDESLKEKVRKVFESRYGRPLSDSEVVEIANNLVGYVEFVNSIERK